MAGYDPARPRTNHLASDHAMPKLWIYTQALIVLFVLIGMVIAIVRLA